MDQEWMNFINKEKEKQYLKDTLEFIKKERLTKTIYPEQPLILNAMKLCPYWDLKVVIIGGEPPSTIQAANGLAFATMDNFTTPSLSNIFKEIADDVYAPWRNSQMNLFKSNHLMSWAKQGVLLWNSVLTVEKGIAGSHRGKGWEELTVNLIQFLNDYPFKLTYMLWGKHAHAYAQYIGQNHTILKAAHPSPHTAIQGFFGCKHFSQANHLINKHYFNKKAPITWAIV